MVIKIRIRIKSHTCSSFQLGEGERAVMDVSGGGTIEKCGFNVFAVDVGWEFVGDGGFGKGFIFGERAPGSEAGGGDGL